MVLRTQLKNRLLGQHNDIPTIEMPADPDVKPGHPDVVTIFYSGDGGWRDIDRLSAQAMNEAGYPVVGVDALRYFCSTRVRTGGRRPGQPDAGYREKWNAKHFVLAGYSFGADILPAVYNRLPKADQDQVTSLLLLAFSRKSNFEIAVEGWLGKRVTKPTPCRKPARSRRQAVLRLWRGREGRQRLYPAGPAGREAGRPGGHHFDENYDKLADFMVKAIEARTPQ